MTDKSFFFIFIYKKKGFQGKLEFSGTMWATISIQKLDFIFIFLFLIVEILQ